MRQGRVYGAVFGAGAVRAAFGLLVIQSFVETARIKPDCFLWTPRRRIGG